MFVEYYLLNDGSSFTFIKGLFIIKWVELLGSLIIEESTVSLCGQITVLFPQLIQYFPQDISLNVLPNKEVDILINRLLRIVL